MGTGQRTLMKVMETIEDRRALVQRIIESEGFAKSERLCEFLTFICKATFDGKESELNEQKIGIEVFGRRPDYDASVDGIVRPNASRLRHRLDSFFEGEGASEPIRLYLPRGTYIPRFEPRALIPGVTFEQPSLVSYKPKEEEERSRPSQLFHSSTALIAALGSLCLVLACVCVALLAIRHRALGAATSVPLRHPFWGVFFRPNEHVIVVPSDTGLVMWEAVSHKSLGLDAYVNGSYRTEKPDVSGKTVVDSVDLASRRYTSLVDLFIVKGVTQLASGTSTKVDVHYARDLRADEMKEGNFILIGAPAANPWLELFDPFMNFTFASAQLKRYTILNHKPLSAEPPLWSSDYDDPGRRVYSVVAFLPNLSGAGNVLLLEGTSMAGTGCAWDFVSQDTTLLPFLSRIRRKDGSVPHFQLVLECTNLTGSSTKRNLLAFRVTD